MRAVIKILCISTLAFFCSSCGGGGSGATAPPPPPPTSGGPTVTVNADIKQLNFSWTAVAGATHYRLLENPDGVSGFNQIGPDIPAGTLTANLSISVHRLDFVNALYIVQSCATASCTDSNAISVTNFMLSTIGYFKGSNAGDKQFGSEVALSADGSTMAVGANFESSSATGINGDQSDNSAFGAGAVYLFRHDGTSWSQHAYIKASNTDAGDSFGSSLALSADGNTLVVGASAESSSATGINGDQSDNSAPQSGAAYVFRYDGADWFQEAYLKASNAEANDSFSGALALSADGNTLVIGASVESSNASGIDGNQGNNLADRSGAVYVFRFDSANWFQQAYVKASNSEAEDGFGGNLALSADGSTLAVGSGGEGSNATGINGNQNDNSDIGSGAVYVFRYDGANWAQQAYVKASNTDESDAFGGGRSRQIGLSVDGNTLAVSAYNEQSNATGVNGDQNDNSVDRAGAAYIFTFDGADWSQDAYIKSLKAVGGKRFGYRIALSADGRTLAAGVQNETGCDAGVGGDESNDSCGNTGAVYVFSNDALGWAQTAYVKASNPDGGSIFGDGYGGWAGIALNADGSALAIGADAEASDATGIGGNQNSNSSRSGAVYLY